MLNAPCKVFSDLSLPRHYHLSGARVGARLYIFGGTVQGSSWPSNTLYILHTASRQVEVHTQPPESGKGKDGVLWPGGLSGHASCAIGSSVYIFGGMSSTNKPAADRYRQPVWELNTSACRQYSPPLPSLIHAETLEWYRRGKLLHHMLHGTATPIDQRRIVLFGGEGCDSQGPSLAVTPRNDVVVFDTLTGEFTQVKVAGKYPPARYGHAAVCWQNKVVVHGGRGSSLLSDVWVLDTQQWKWHGPVPSPDSGMPGRVHHSASLLGGQMVMYGGEYASNQQLNDVLVYDILASRFFNIPVRVCPLVPRLTLCCAAKCGNRAALWARRVPHRRHAFHRGRRTRPSRLHRQGEASPREHAPRLYLHRHRSRRGAHSCAPVDRGTGARSPAARRVEHLH